MNAIVKSAYIDDYGSLAAQLPGRQLPWLIQLRQAALAQFSACGFPSPREEEWRYTNISALEKNRFNPALKAAENTLDNAWVASQKLSGTYCVVLVDGHYSAKHSDLAGLPPSVRILDMADALSTGADTGLNLSEYLGQAVAVEEHSLVAFNTAWFYGGVLVHIPAGCVLDKPIQLLHVASQAGSLTATRNLVVMAKQAQAQVIESFTGLDQAYLTAAVTEVFIGENAGLELFKLQNEAGKAYHFGGTYVKQARDARFKHHNFAFGSLLARTDLHTDLTQGCDCQFNGLYLGTNRQHLDNHTRINHLQPYATSRQLYKGVLDDRARGVFQGRVIVAEQAQKTDSDMNNRNLLLSADAEIDTKPQLEIYADDVKCGHGLTVGQLDEKSVFYLQSRGVDEETARNMLTFAFANEMADKITIKSLHDAVLNLVLARFPQEGVEKDWL